MPHITIFELSSLLIVCSRAFDFIHRGQLHLSNLDLLRTRHHKRERRFTIYSCLGYKYLSLSREKPKNKPVVRMTIKNAMRTPYNVPLGLSNKSIIKERAAMFEKFEPAITQPFNKAVVYSCFDKGCPTKSVKAYATMPIGIMGRKSLALID